MRKKKNLYSKKNRRKIKTPPFEAFLFLPKLSKQRTRALERTRLNANETRKKSTFVQKIFDSIHTSVRPWRNFFPSSWFPIAFVSARSLNYISTEWKGTQPPSDRQKEFNLSLKFSGEDAARSRLGSRVFNPSRARRFHGNYQPKGKKSNTHIRARIRRKRRNKK